MEFEVNLLEKNRHLLWVEIWNRNRLVLLLLLAGIVIIGILSLHSKFISTKTNQMVTSGEGLLRISVEKERASNLMKLLQRVEKERIVWSQKLRCLGVTVPDQVYLTSLELRDGTPQSGGSAKTRGKEKIVLRGVVISSGAGEPASILAKFMQAIRDNPSFAAEFQDPALVAVFSGRKEDTKTEQLSFEFEIQHKAEQ